MAKAKYVPKAMSLKNNVVVEDRTNTIADGPVDFGVLQESGRIVRRVSADPGPDLSKPAAALFMCQCGYVRRIVFDQPNFHCENPNGCGIFWKMRLLPDGWDEDGHQKYKPLFCQHKDGKCDHASVMPFKHETNFPVIDGFDMHEVQQESRAAKRLEGTALQPQAIPKDELKEEVPTVVEDTHDDEDNYDKG